MQRAFSFTSLWISVALGKFEPHRCWDKSHDVAVKKAKNLLTVSLETCDGLKITRLSPGHACLPAVMSLMWEEPDLDSTVIITDAMKLH